MKVFVAGATGAIGRPLVAQLLEAGHDVSAITRSEGNARRLREQGVDAYVGDALDGEQLGHLVEKVRPEIIQHQLTTFPTSMSPIHLVKTLRQTVRLRIKGARLFVDLARRFDVRRVVAQSIAFGYKPLSEQKPVTEDDPFYGHGRRAMDLLMRHLLRVEEIVTQADGIEGVGLRYGGWYGPGTHFVPGGMVHRLAMKRRLPIVRGARGLWNAIQVEDAASASVAAMTGPAGIYNVVDDEPMPMADVVTSYCDAMDAPAPRMIPRRATLLLGFYTRHLYVDQMPVSSAKARADLGWKPMYPSFKDGLNTLTE